jgi:hypothetical protein
VWRIAGSLESGARPKASDAVELTASLQGAILSRDPSRAGRESAPSVVSFEFCAHTPMSAIHLSWGDHDELRSAGLLL